jgi:hypothetical protein
MTQLTLFLVLDILDSSAALLQEERIDMRQTQLKTRSEDER